MAPETSSDPNELAVSATFGTPEDPLIVASAFVVVLVPEAIGWQVEVLETVDEGFGPRQVSRGAWWRASRKLARRKGLYTIRRIIRHRFDRFDHEQRSVVIDGKEAYE